MVYERTKQHIKNNRASILLGYERGRIPPWQGKKRPEHSILMKEYYRIGRIKPIRMFGLSNPSWKGDRVSYSALHSWIKKTLGKPTECKICQTNETKRYEWAMIGKTYGRNPKNWISLCASCHRYIDGNGSGSKNLLKRLHSLKENYSSKMTKINRIISYYKQI